MGKRHLTARGRQESACQSRSSPRIPCHASTPTKRQASRQWPAGPPRSFSDKPLARGAPYGSTRTRASLTRTSIQSAYVPCRRYVNLWFTSSCGPPSRSSPPSPLHSSVVRVPNYQLLRLSVMSSPPVVPFRTPYTIRFPGYHTLIPL